MTAILDEVYYDNVTGIIYMSHCGLNYGRRSARFVGGGGGGVNPLVLLNPPS